MVSPCLHQLSKWLGQSDAALQMHMPQASRTCTCEAGLKTWQSPHHITGGVVCKGISILSHVLICRCLLFWLPSAQHPCHHIACLCLHQTQNHCCSHCKLTRHEQHAHMPQQDMPNEDDWGLPSFEVRLRVHPIGTWQPASYCSSWHAFWALQVHACIDNSSKPHSYNQCMHMMQLAKQLLTGLGSCPFVPDALHWSFRACCACIRSFGPHRAACNSLGS